MQLGDFIGITAQAHSLESLHDLFRYFRQQHNLPFLAYGSNIPQHKNYESRIAQPVHVEYPTAWIEHYEKRRYIKDDPTVRMAHACHEEFAWDEVRGLTANERHMMLDAQAAGIATGLTVPIHGPGGTLHIVALSGTTRDTLGPADRALLRAAAHQYHVCYLRLCGEEKAAPPPALTEREREVLSWVAAGKSTADIGSILSISEHTVNYHIRNAMDKLGARTRMLAVVMALRFGLITP